MNALIKLEEYPVKNVLKLLLADKTTKKNIMFATEAYAEFGVEPTTQITPAILSEFGSVKLQPRAYKSMEEQSQRTRKKAEVFTPSWICNKMNNHCDNEWFGREGVFNQEDGQSWIVNTAKIEFAKPKDWQRYVDSKRLEITCGEAPYLVSRYDTTTAAIIPIVERIGILDRKLRVVNENTDSEKDWLNWTIRAFQSVYGYEFQGDNLLIARINMLMTFVDYMKDRWDRQPTLNELKKLANIIAWNLWQMDGITGTIPYGKPREEYQQIDLFDFTVGEEESEIEEVECKIHDWRSKETMTFRSIKRDGGNK